MSILIHVSVVLQREEALLLVQERKPENYERWNLPGGHLEIGETPQEGAVREALEETGLVVTLSELVGIYTRFRKPDYQAIRFVFTAEHTGEPVAGDDILAVRWFTSEEIAALPDTTLVGGERLRSVLADFASGRRYPLTLLKAPI
ncbi:MAG TPA: NUDIX domain-containing protein [Chthonomonadaceae bacterium]|nr:NUDIX domain-containing protein [Chthonomonadaceae bacterium]